MGGAFARATLELAIHWQMDEYHLRKVRRSVVDDIMKFACIYVQCQRNVNMNCLFGRKFFFLPFGVAWALGVVLGISLSEGRRR